jgi:inosine/xanthosine triphosphatase
MKKISIGSENPAKVAAVENAVRKVWPDAAVIAVKVAAGVNEQPRSDDEAIAGAINRARLSLRKAGSDLGIGLESCTIDTKYGMFTAGWVVAVGRGGEVGMGCTGKILLPERVASEIRKGKELGPVMDGLAGIENTKQKQGTIGILTGNRVTRTMSFEDAVIYALAKFITPEYYK